jgi:hypothetical protein
MLTTLVPEPTDQMIFATAFMQYFMLLLPLAAIVYIGYRASRSSNFGAVFVWTGIACCILIFVLMINSEAVASVFMPGATPELADRFIVACAFVYAVVAIAIVVGGYIGWLVFIVKRHKAAKSASEPDGEEPESETHTS